MCPLGSRVRYADASLGGHLAGTVPGAAKVETVENPVGSRVLQGGTRPRQELPQCMVAIVAYPQLLRRRECGEGSSF
jgi:hypothetical protein